MEKFARRLGLGLSVLATLLLVLMLSGHLRVADARITGVNPVGTSADEFCVGKKSFEVCVDYLGNWLPTTNNTQSLGTSALNFSNVFSNAVTVGAGGYLQSSNGPVELGIQTTTQLSLDVYPAGAIVLAQESVAGALVTNQYNLCMSTQAQAGTFVYVVVSTSAQAVVGAKCNS